MCRKIFPIDWACFWSFWGTPWPARCDYVTFQVDLKLLNNHRAHTPGREWLSMSWDLKLKHRKHRSFDKNVQNRAFRRKIGILGNLPEQRARVCYLFRLLTEVVLTQNNIFFQVWLCRNRWSRSIFLIKIHGFSRFRTISRFIRKSFKDFLINQSFSGIWCGFWSKKSIDIIYFNTIKPEKTCCFELKLPRLVV